MHTSNIEHSSARTTRVLLAALALVALGRPLAAQHDHAAGEHLGTVRFQTSCSSAAQADFTRSVTLLHSFAFSRATEGFQGVQRTDPNCAIAWWGIAVSAWGNPFAAGLKTPAQIASGLAAIERARATGQPTERERGYIAAAARLYERADSLSQRTRLLAYRDALAGLVALAPADTEAMIFHALSQVAAADPTDKTYAGQLAAGATLERLFAVLPDHPGLAHYIIHAYDVPALADRARAAADRYADIAPSVSHALHMPSHTYTRIGAWQQSIQSNSAAGAAAEREGATAEQLHTMDYRMYAYLQTGQERAAHRLLDTLPAVTSHLATSQVMTAAAPPSGYYAAAAIPARWALERGMWAEAAALEVHPSATPYADAITWFAKGLGAARSGDTAAARVAVNELARLRDVLSQRGETYWTEQVEIQRRATLAWLDYAAGRRSEALAGMREAADREGATEKAAVTPGPLAPARELLGEMLLASGQPAEALAAFDATLQHEPNRYRATAGAAQAATAAGDSARARQYQDRLRQLAAGGDRRPATPR